MPPDLSDPGALLFLAMTGAGCNAPIVQGLVVHEFVSRPFYGFRVPRSRAGESHIRSVEALLDHILAIDNRPLQIARPVKQRLVGVCHHFMLLFVAISTVFNALLNRPEVVEFAGQHAA